MSTELMNAVPLLNKIKHALEEWRVRGVPWARHQHLQLSANRSRRPLAR
jgi:hypothetical protein